MANSSICSICAKSTPEPLRQINEIHNNETILPISTLQAFVPNINWNEHTSICKLCKAYLIRACDFREKCLTSGFFDEAMGAHNDDGKICNFCSKVSRTTVCEITAIGLNDTISSIAKLKSCVPDINWFNCYCICNRCKYLLDEVYAFHVQCLKNVTSTIRSDDDDVKPPTGDCDNTTITRPMSCREVGIIVSREHLTKLVELNGVCNICSKSKLGLRKINESTTTDGGDIVPMSMLIRSLPEIVWLDLFLICKKCRLKLADVYDFHQMCHKSDLFRDDDEMRNSNSDDETNNNHICNLCRCPSLNKSPLHKLTEPIIVTGGDSDREILLSQKMNRFLPHITWPTNFRMCIVCKRRLDRAYTFLTACNRSQYKRQLDVLGMMGNQSKQPKNHDAPKSSEQPKNHDAPESSNLPKNHDPPMSSNQPKNPHQLTRKKSFTCDYCQKSFRNRYSTKTHIRVHHTHEKLFLCEICGENFVSMHRLTLHLRSHSQTLLFTCDLCGKSFRRDLGLARHMKVHRNRKEYGCKQCEKRFNTGQGLRTHIIYRHTARTEWKYSCTLCEHAKFPRKSGLVMHLKRHANDRQFACDLCAKRFVMQGELNTHMRKHAARGASDLHCEYCEQVFRLPSKLQKHLKRDHPHVVKRRKRINSSFIMNSSLFIKKVAVADETSETTN